MKQDRPVNLNLFKFKFPVMAIVSVIHRISGVIIFLFVPAMLYMLHESLMSQSSFEALQTCLHHVVSKLLVWIMLSAVLFHLVAGIRHLTMDLGLAESKQVGRVTAWSVITIVAVLVVWLGVWLW